MAEDITAQLKNSFLFKGLSDEALAAVAQKASLRDLAEGDVLMRRGERAKPSDPPERCADIARPLR